MIVSNGEKNVVTKTGLTNGHAFAFSTKNLAKQAYVLGDGLYSDGAMAVIREYSTNAKDIHRIVGTPDRPIVVTLPTLLTPIFKVRDFGTGLTEDDIYNVYTVYFESTKEGTNDQIGFLGLGSKAGFAHAEVFTVTSIVSELKLRDAISHMQKDILPNTGEEEYLFQKNIYDALLSAYANIHGTDKNWRVVFTAYKDEDLMPRMDKQFEVATEEETGIEVSIPIATSVDDFNAKALQFYRWFAPRPIFEGANSVFNQGLLNHDKEIKHSKWNGQSGDWKWALVQGEKSVVIMGDTAYPIPYDIWSESESVTRNLVISGGLIIWANIGDVTNTPSRESIKKDRITVKAFRYHVARIAAQIRRQGRKSMTKASTKWEALVAYNNSLSMPSYLRSIIINKPIFNGRPLETTKISSSLMDFIILSCCYPEDAVLVKQYERQCEVVNSRSGKLTELEIEELMSEFNGEIPTQKPEKPKINDIPSLDYYANTSEDYQQKRLNASRPHEITPYEKLTFCLSSKGKFAQSRRSSYLKGAIKHAENNGYKGMLYIEFPNEEALNLFLLNDNITGAPYFRLENVEPLFDIKNNHYSTSIKSKHRAFQFNKKANHYHGTRSNSWDIVDVDLENGEGVYVQINNFNLDTKETSYFSGWAKWGTNNHNRMLDEMIRRFNVHGIVVPNIYGFKSSTKFNKMGKGWVPFGEWLEKTLIEELSKTAQIRANHLSLTLQDLNYSKLFPLLNQLPEGKIHHFISLVKKSKLPDDHLALKVLNLTYCIHDRVFEATRVDPDVDFCALRKEVEEEYPLLSIILENKESLSDKYREQFIKYIGANFTKK